jgi:ATP-binding cassette subfamily B protein
MFGRGGFGPFTGKIERAKDRRGTVLRIWLYLRRQRGALILTGFLVLGSTATNLLGPYLLGRAIDQFILAHDLPGLGRLCFLMLGAYLLGALFTYLQSYVMAGAAQRTVRDLRNDLFAKLQTLPLRTFDQRPHGDLMSRLTNDVENVNLVLSDSLTQLAAGILSMIGVAAAMLLLNPRLTLVSIVTISVLSIAINRWVAPRTRAGFRDQQAALGRLNGLIEETITGQRVVKAFNREPVVIAEFDDANQQLRQAATRAQTFAGFVGPLMNVVNNLGLALVAGIGGWMAVGGLASVGTIASFINYARQFGQPLNSFANLYNTIQAAVAGAERVFEVIDEEPEIDVALAFPGVKALAGPSFTDEPAKALTPDGGPRFELVARAERVFEVIDEEPEVDVALAFPGVKALAGPSEKDGPAKTLTPDRGPRFELRGEVVFDDVSFAYVPGVPVLKHISLHARSGQTVALVGPTGAGKTTIVNLLTRFYEIDQGAIQIDGRDLRTLNKESLRRQLGIVLQDTFLFSGTVLDNIRYGRLDATDEEVVAAARLANADQFIHRLPHGYHTLLSERASNLSQGQRQLLAIARAILADPKILILDEATSSIDTRTEKHIQEAMLRLMTGRTSFVIAHRLSTIREADQILVVNHGEIVERGTHAELLAGGGFYAQLYASQFRSTDAPTPVFS